MLGREKGAVPFFGLVLTLRLSVSAGEKDFDFHVIHSPNVLLRG